jgi:hypothetical protein
MSVFPNNLALVFCEQDLQSELGKILRAYKDYVKEEWPRVWGSLDEPVRTKLGQIYGL